MYDDNKKKKSQKNLWIIFPCYKLIQQICQTTIKFGFESFSNYIVFFVHFIKCTSQNWFQSSREIKMHLRLRESSVLSQYCDFCPNHPLQPFPLVVFCVVFFSNKLNKHSHPNSRSRGIFRGRLGIDEQRRPSNSDPVQVKNCLCKQPGLYKTS